MRKAHRRAAQRQRHGAAQRNARAGRPAQELQRRNTAARNPATARGATWAACTQAQRPKGAVQRTASAQARTKSGPDHGCHPPSAKGRQGGQKADQKSAKWKRRGRAQPSGEARKAQPSGKTPTPSGKSATGTAQRTTVADAVPRQKCAAAQRQPPRRSATKTPEAQPRLRRRSPAQERQQRGPQRPAAPQSARSAP